MPRYYLSIRLCPGRLYPTFIVRSAVASVHVVDPRAMKEELLPVALDILEPWEHEQGLRAFGQPPPGTPMARELVEGACLPFVPAAIRLPGEPPIQNPQSHTGEHQQAFRDALEWARMERQMLQAIA